MMDWLEAVWANDTGEMILINVGLLTIVGLVTGLTWLVTFWLPEPPPMPEPKPKHVKPRERTVIDWGGWFSGDDTHVYYFYDRQGNLLYVGITNDLKRRWAQHEADKPWWHLVARKESVKYPTRAEAENVEAHQIRRLRPQFNRAMNGWSS